MYPYLLLNVHALDQASTDMKCTGYIAGSLRSCRQLRVAFSALPLLLGRLQLFPVTARCLWRLAGDPSLPEGAHAAAPRELPRDGIAVLGRSSPAPLTAP